MGAISVEAVAAFVAALGLIVTTISLVYLARQTSAVASQTRAVAEQTEISNAMAAVAANEAVLGALREVHLLLLPRPGARQFFYAGEPLPEQLHQRDDILTIAELLADVMCNGIHTHAKVPGSTSAEPWSEYCRYTLRSSPVLQELVRTHPSWWPCLPPLLPSPPNSPERPPAAASGTTRTGHGPDGSMAGPPHPGTAVPPAPDDTGPR